MIQITQTVCLTTKLWATLETKVGEESAIQNLSNEQETKGEGEKSHFIKGWLTIISQTTLRINILLWSHDTVTYIRTIIKIRIRLFLLRVHMWLDYIFQLCLVFLHVLVLDNDDKCDNNNSPCLEITYKGGNLPY